MKKYRLGFIGKNQISLFLLWREDWDNDEPSYAHIIFEIKTPMWVQNIVWHKLGWYGTVPN